MKKLRIMALTVFIPLISGFVMLFADDENVSRIGGLLLEIGVPVTMFLLVVIGLILIITGKIDLSDYRKTNSDTTPSETPTDAVPLTDAERERNEINEVNSSYHRQSQLRQGEYIARHAATNYRNASPKEKLFSWLFFGFLMTDFALILVFMFLRIFIGMYICFGLFGGTILLSFIVVKTKEKTSLNASKRKRKIREVLSGEVKFCTLSSSTSVGGSSRRSTTRITGVTYRVIIESDGQEYVAYSKEFYNEGDTVRFGVIGKKSATIIDDEDLILS